MLNILLSSLQSTNMSKRRKATAVPHLSAAGATLEAFHQAFAAQQLVFVQQDASRRFGVAGRQIGLSTLRRIFTAYPAVVRRAFSLECRGSLPAHEDPLVQLLAAKAPEGSWYASCVLQRHRQALAEFLSQTLPAGAPGFLLRSTKSKANAVRVTSTTPTLVPEVNFLRKGFRVPNL
ncbi:unnamed protein product [Cladocopium goreaui]|uniref:Uncharacterized protein n=1 Tax=Cladocopium goreaui TaxID=2562237 RepID=A0A9P1CNK1_9DINO|nr:unnamed protein product [Cladocopium goreaui]